MPINYSYQLLLLSCPLQTVQHRSKQRCSEITSLVIRTFAWNGRVQAQAGGSGSALNRARTALRPSRAMPSLSSCLFAQPHCCASQQQAGAPQPLPPLSCLALAAEWDFSKPHSLPRALLREVRCTATVAYKETSFLPTAAPSGLTELSQ